jgi:glycine/D-amino acid oxidase-like deaminating enzyme
MVTKPLDNIPFKGTFHMDEGYVYFRDLDDRVLIGGGRNLDFEQETTTEEGRTEGILNYLKELLQNVVLPNRSFDIEYTWSGIMGFGKDKQPIVAKIAPATYAAVRMNGMGVAIAGSVGEQVADLLAEQLAG